MLLDPFSNEWVEYPDPFYFLKTTGTTLMRPKAGLKVYAIGGHGYGKSVRIFDLESNGLVEVPNAFSQELYQSPCAFNVDNETIQVLGEMSSYFKNVLNLEDAWVEDFHELGLRPACLTISPKDILIIDPSKEDGKYLLNFELGYKPLDFQLISSHKSHGIKLAFFDGSPVIFHDDETEVEVLEIKDEQVLVTSAKNQMLGKRTQFSLVQVPISFLKIMDSSEKKNLK